MLLVVGALVAVPPLLAATALAVAAWPTTAALGLMLVAIAVLARYRPAVSFLIAVIAFGLEGVIKVALTGEGSPLPLGPDAIGAITLDAGLLIAVLGLIAHDGLRTVRRIWAEADAVARIAFGIFVAWLLLSVVQVAQSGDLARGLAGFRLTQFYVIAMLGALIALSRPSWRRQADRLTLVGLSAIAGYAALRVLIGPATAERQIALSKGTVATYGGVFRTVGSFSSSIGMDSFLVPAAVVGLVCGLLLAGRRRWGWTVATLAVVGIIGSYDRTAIVAMAVTLLAVVALVIVGRQLSGRQKLAVAGLLVLVLGGGGVGTVVAAQSSPVLRKRVQGILHPSHDASLRLRVDTWHAALERASRSPFGVGLGMVGHASGVDRRHPVTTDNSYLKVLVEQGILGAVLFLAGSLGICLAIARRLRRAEAPTAWLGLAALSGFGSFLVLGVTGEFIEQPGKVLAWALLGAALAYAFQSAPPSSAPVASAAPEAQA